MSDERAKRRLAAILAADVVGYSRMMQADEAGTLAVLKSRRREILQPIVSKHQGRVVKLMGDGVLIEFASAVNAVNCAVELQKRMGAANAGAPEDKGITLRIGINIGDVIVEGSDLYGDGVNIAARLEALAEAGSVYVSHIVFGQVRGKVEVGFEDLGEQTLKNIATPVRIFRLTNAPVIPVTEAESASDKPSIAVLPFTNMSGDPEQEYFSDGITEDIITELSRSQSLFVIARNSSFVFKGRATDIKEIGKKLGVRYVVEGSIRKAGARIRITAQLIEASTGNHVWAERYDRSLEDLFAVQDEVTEKITWALVGKVEDAEIGWSVRMHKRLDSYDALLRGIEAMRRFTEKDTAAAIDFFQLALSLEPDSATAHARLAGAYANLSSFSTDQSMKVLTLEAARQAIKLGDSSGLAEAVVAACCAWSADFEAAEVHWRRALMLGPTNPEVLSLTGFICLWGGEIAKACEVGERLKRLSPLERHDVHQLLAFGYYLLGDYRTSLESFRRWNNDNYHRGFANLAACLGQIGRIDEAKAAWSRCLEVKPGYTIEDYRHDSPYRRQEDLEHWLDGLRKAGIE